LSAVLAAVVVTAGSVFAPAAADEPPALVSVQVTPSEVDLDTGFATFVVDVSLTDPEGLPDVIDPRSSEPWPMPAVLALPDANNDGGGVALAWKSLTRVSGTPKAGVWRGVTEVSPAWVGRYTVRYISVLDCANCAEDAPGQFSVDGPVLTITGVRSWLMVNPSSIRVVTGQERWTPQALVLDGFSAAPVPGAWVTTRDFWGSWMGTARQRTAPGVRVGADGIWTAGYSIPIADAMWDQDYASAYGARGTRGWSLETVMTLSPRIKWQANSRYAAIPGGAVSVTGNFWPAPSVLGQSGTGPNVYLQRLTPAGAWETVATSRGRDNGRYSLMWTPPDEGTAHLRIRLPGRGTPAGGYAGTILASVLVAL
jgi:hypothetical protein